MDEKKIIWLFVFIGSTVGSYIPILWGASFLSFSSVLFSGIGGIIGIWLGLKFNE